MRLEWLLRTTLAASLAASTSVLPGDAKWAATDPLKAGPDFDVQGEYVGEVAARDGRIRLGAQVIARGSGRFQAAFYPGGLPGAGWDRHTAKAERMNSQFGQGGVVFAGSRWHAEIRDRAMTVDSPQGEQLGELKRVERKSPTMGKAPPAGAIVLFDGSTTEHFRGGRTTEDGLLQEGATTKHNVQSFLLHLEFRTPFQPWAIGQQRGNSGVYIQRRYEVQILDSFGLEGKWNGCGGVYEVKAPDVNMCFPPLSWQTYDIEFTAPQFDETGKKVRCARITVLHNGVAIHDDLEIPNKTGAGKPEGPDPGPIYLQNHGNPVRFRNVWIVERGRP